MITIPFISYKMPLFSDSFWSVINCHHFMKSSALWEIGQQHFGTACTCNINLSTLPAWTQVWKWYLLLINFFNSNISETSLSERLSGWVMFVLVFVPERKGFSVVCKLRDPGFTVHCQLEHNYYCSRNVNG